jgi:hypothetical protein
MAGKSMIAFIYGMVQDGGVPPYQKAPTALLNTSSCSEPKHA